MSTVSPEQAPTAFDSRERTATRLLASSAKASFDPLTEIDWAAPLDPDACYLPPRRSSLYGTDLWDRLSHAQRVELTKYEIAGVTGAGIFFELILMQLLVRHAQKHDAATAHVQFALTEIADECRHSIMFGKAITKFGARIPVLPFHLQKLGEGFAALANGPLSFAAALFVEEVLDSFQREAMNDGTLQPLVRATSRIHVVEEARHIRFASEELARQWDTLPAAKRAYSRVVLAALCTLAQRELVPADAYAAAGLDPVEARAVAAANPHWLATRRWASRKAMARFDQIGLLDGRARGIWERAGLLPDPA